MSPTRDPPLSPLPGEFDPVTRHLLAACMAQGTAGELALLNRHARLLSELMAPVTSVLAAGLIDLEIGISGGLRLEISLTGCRGLPAAALRSVLRDHSELAGYGEFVLHQRLDYQYGLRLTPERATVRLCAASNPVVAQHPEHGPLHQFRSGGAQDIPPHRLCEMDSDGGCRLYAPSSNLETLATLQAATGVNFSRGFQTATTIEEVELSKNGDWARGRSAVRATPFPAWIIKRALAAIDSPGFAYFTTTPGIHRYGYLAVASDGGLELYTPMRGT